MPKRKKTVVRKAAPLEKPPTKPSLPPAPPAAASPAPPAAPAVEKTTEFLSHPGNVSKLDFTAAGFLAVHREGSDVTDVLVLSANCELAGLDGVVQAKLAAKETELAALRKDLEDLQGRMVDLDRHSADIRERLASAAIGIEHPRKLDDLPPLDMLPKHE